MKRNFPNHRRYADAKFLAIWRATALREHAYLVSGFRSQPEPALLRALLGVATDDLPQIILDAHASPLRALGVFRVEASPTAIGRLAARVWRLPAPGDEVAVTVCVEKTAKGQRWDRSFGSHRMVTHQWVENGLLIEASGVGRIGMRLTIEDVALHYQTVRAWLGVLPLPVALVPAVTACVRESEGGWSVEVKVRQGPFGILCRYSGKMALA